MWRTENLNSVQIRDMQRLVKTENYTPPHQPRPPWSLMAHFYAKKGYKFTQFGPKSILICWNRMPDGSLWRHSDWLRKMQVRL